MIRPPVKNETALYPALCQMSAMLDNKEFTVDLDGGRTIELIGERLVFNPYQPVMDFGVRKTNVEYVEKELKWYLDQDLNIHPIMEDVKIWRTVADNDGFINSNYGYLIFSKENGEQYKNCFERLNANLSSKRGVMIYTRPSMWTDCSVNGRNDFICTDGVQCSIKNNRLYYMVKQRSCDMIFGLFNDLAWHQFVYKKLLTDLRKEHKDLVVGAILYFPFNLHIYERHFKFIVPMLRYLKEYL